MGLLASDPMEVVSWSVTSFLIMCSCEPGLVGPATHDLATSWNKEICP